MTSHMPGLSGIAVQTDSMGSPPGPSVTANTRRSQRLSQQPNMAGMAKDLGSSAGGGGAVRLDGADQDRRRGPWSCRLAYNPATMAPAPSAAVLIPAPVVRVAGLANILG